MSNIGIETLTLKKAAELIRSREMSPVELVQAYLNRIEQVEDRVKAWVTLVPEQALAQARQAEHEILHNQYRGPLHGIPYGAKDIIHTVGIRTSGGSQVEPDYVPAENAAIINKLSDAGAILLGKTTTTEFAFLGGEPATRNPWNLAHTPGDRVPDRLRPWLHPWRFLRWEHRRLAPYFVRRPLTVLPASNQHMAL